MTPYEQAAEDEFQRQREAATMIAEEQIYSQAQYEHDMGLIRAFRAFDDHTPRCKQCGEKLLTNAEIAVQYHTARWDGFSCLDRAKDLAG